MFSVQVRICLYKLKGSTYRPVSSLSGAVVWGKLTRMCETLTARKGNNVWKASLCWFWERTMECKIPQPCPQQMLCADIHWWHVWLGLLERHNPGDVEVTLVTFVPSDQEGRSLWRTHSLSRDYCHAKYIDMDFQITLGNIAQPLFLIHVYVTFRQCLQSAAITISFLCAKYKRYKAFSVQQSDCVCATLPEINIGR